MSLGERYEHHRRSRIEHLKELSPWDLIETILELEESIVKMHEDGPSGHLDAEARSIRWLMDLYDEDEEGEYPQFDHACFYGCTDPDHERVEYQ